MLTRSKLITKTYIKNWQHLVSATYRQTNENKLIKPILRFVFLDIKMNLFFVNRHFWLWNAFTIWIVSWPQLLADDLCNERSFSLLFGVDIAVIIKNIIYISAYESIYVLVISLQRISFIKSWLTFRNLNFMTVNDAWQLSQNVVTKIRIHTEV